MLARLCLGASLLLVACGGADGTPFADGPDQPVAGAPGGGSAAAGAGATGSAAVSAAGGGQGGSVAAGSPGTGTGGGGAPVVTAGAGGTLEQVGGHAGAGTGGATGGQAVGGSSSGGAAAGIGGKATGGGAGQPGESLDPQPVPGCPGYVKILIPHGTCVWLHGTFTYQSESCGLQDPPVEKCATGSAPGSATTMIVSDAATVERFDFGPTGCPKSCQ